ncbi:DEAD/DEAH box helicase [Micromonospora aurantiaca (nom. illeg.)]|uniref:DEAD/DEAH box helicase n=1 Tax=Micromonospora aurantiaca (nom. illeg.) TaxID=47850 RepID=UPI003EB95D8D
MAHTHIQQFLDIKPGQLGGGRRKLTGTVDIALLPSLARRDDVATLTQGYGHVIVDGCHHLGAAAYEHSAKRIAAQFWLGLTATPTRRDGLGQLVTWQLGPVRHTLTDEEQGTLEAAMHTDAGPRRALFIHETTFQPGDVDLDAHGALAEVHRRAGPRRAPQHPDRRRRRRSPHPRPQLSRPDPTGRPRRGTRRRARRTWTPGSRATRRDKHPRTAGHR